MHNKQLETLVCVADCGSFAKASEKLFISTTAVMKQINLLEDRLGLKIFARDNQGVKLTPQGKSLYADAIKMFEYSANAIKKAKEVAENHRITLRIGSSMINPAKIFLDIWENIKGQMPHYDFRIVNFIDNKTDALSKVDALEDKYDVLSGVCDSRTLANKCQFLKFGQYKVSLAVPKNHRLAGNAQINMPDLFGEKIMLVKKGDSPTVDDVRSCLMNLPQITIKDADHFYDIDVFNDCVNNNCLLLSLECWKDMHPQLVTIPVNWHFTMAYGILYSINPSQIVQDFIFNLQSISKDDPI